MAEVTLRVQTPLPGWEHGQLVAVERSEFVDALLDTGRVVLVADPESEAFDQGEEPEVPADGSTPAVELERPVGQPKAAVKPARARARRPATS